MSIIINNNSNINNNNSEIVSYEKIKQNFNNFFNNIFEITFTNKKNSLEFNNNNNNNQTLKNSLKINNNKFSLFKNNSIENKENISNNNNNKINSNENNNFLIFNNNNNNFNNNFNNKKLFYWLKSIELENYYNLFKNNNIEIEKLKKNNFNFNRNLLEKIGIKKIGHIFRILIKIELELKIISPKIKNFLFEKKEILLKNGKEIYYLNELNENIFCFNLFNKEIKIKKKFIFDYWLKKNKIFHLKKNFIENGFDFFEYFIIQMFSNFPIDEKILKNEMKIKNSFEREIILFQLNKDVKYIKRNIK